MNLIQEMKKRKEGILIGGGIGLGLYFLGKYFIAKQALQSVVLMAAQEPSIATKAWGLTADWRVAIAFVVIGAAIGSFVDKR